MPPIGPYLEVVVWVGARVVAALFVCGGLLLCATACARPVDQAERPAPSRISRDPAAFNRLRFLTVEFDRPRPDQPAALRELDLDPFLHDGRSYTCSWKGKMTRGRLARIAALRGVVAIEAASFTPYDTGDPNP